jgi:hypothetical protein
MMGKADNLLRNWINPRAHCPFALRASVPPWFNPASPPATLRDDPLATLETHNPSVNRALSMCQPLLYTPPVRALPAAK